MASVVQSQQMTSDDIMAGKAIHALLEGGLPTPDASHCGHWAPVLTELVQARDAGGTDAVRAAFDAMAKEEPSLVLLQSLHAEAPLAGIGEEIQEMLRPGCGGEPPILPPIDHARALEQLAPFVDRLMIAKQVKMRDRKRAAAHVIRRLLTRQGRLLLDTQEGDVTGTPYVVGDDRAIWPLTGDLLPVRAMLGKAGLSVSEPAFRWLVSDLETTAYNDCPRVTLSHFWVRRDDTLYVSAGPPRIVRARHDGEHIHLDVLPNGTDDVYFASDTVLPVWEPCKPIAPTDLAAFCPALITPPDEPAYTPDIQQLLLTAWLVGLVAHIRPLPLLALIGDKGGGKTHTIRCVSMLITRENPTTVSQDPRDLWTSAVRRPVLALDNVDCVPPPWLPDLLAAVVTGVTYERRRLFTDHQMERQLVKAVLAISTRTAAFARPDVAERTLPILTGEFRDGDRSSDEDLIGQVEENRAAVLTWLLTEAVRVLRRISDAPALPFRFVDFARTVWAYAPEQATTALTALQRIQAMTIGDADPLISALLEFSDRLLSDQAEWEGTPTALVRQLENLGANVSRIGKGKAIARSLREGASTLALYGLQTITRKSGNNTLFVLSRS